MNHPAIVASTGNLWVGGSFAIAGEKASSKIGCYSGATPSILFIDGFESGDTTQWH